MVKGWLDNNGVSQEKIYNVSWSGTRRLDAALKLPEVGNSVDIKNASWQNTIGAAQLTVVWQDPDFNEDHPAFYYVRVLEIPTPRWTAYDAKRYEITMPADVPMVTRERAYTSPIWYTPEVSEHASSWGMNSG